VEVTFSSEISKSCEIQAGVLGEILERKLKMQCDILDWILKQKNDINGIFFSFGTEV
jgi:hypothetical protein